MIRKALIVLGLLLVVGGRFGHTQTVTLSPQITDSDSTNWQSGTYVITLIQTQPGTPYRTDTGQNITTVFSGTMNGSGVFSVTLTDTNFIAPSGSRWQFYVCPLVTGASCATVITTVTAGNASTIPALLNASLTAPRITGGPFTQAYNDTEVAALPNNSYYSLTSTANRCYTGQAGLGTWGGCGGGGGGGVSSITGDGTIFNNSASTGAVTLTLTNTPTGTGGVVLAVSPTLTGTPDASGAAQFKLPVASGATTLANGELKYDTTNLNWHAWGNGVDNIVALFPASSTITNGDCVEWVKSGNVVTQADTGAACGSGSGAVNSVTNSDGTLTISPTTGSVVASLNLAHADTWTAAHIFSVAGAASTPGLSITGAPFLGSGTTSTGQLLLGGGTAATTLSTNGTMLEINPGSGFTGNFIDARVNGAASAVYVVTFAGNLQAKGGMTITNGTMSQTLGGSSNTAATSTAGNVPFAVNNSNASPTANLQTWAANSVVVANVTPTGIFSSAVGFNIPSATTAGHYLRNNATNYVDSAIQAADLPLGSTSAFGAVKCDGTTITCTAGVIAAVGGGSGTVTSFSAGNLSPLFTTSVATATSTPALTFALSNAAQNSVLAGPATGGAGAPSYQTAPTISAANMTSFPTFNQNTTGTAANLSGTPALPNGTTATTQTVGDNTTKLATDAFVLANASGISGLTTGFLPKAASSTTLNNSHLDDGVTNAGAVTSSIPVIVNDTTDPNFIGFAANGVAAAVQTSKAGWGLAATLTTAGIYLMPDAPGSGFWTASNAAGVVTNTFTPFIGAGTVSITGGSGVTSATCTSTSCTNQRGSITIVGGTATTGTIATVNFSSTLSTVPVCMLSQNGTGATSTASFDVGHAQTTGALTISAGLTVIGATIVVDYACAL